MVKFKNKNQAIDMFNAAEMWLWAFQDKKDEFYLKMEKFDDPSHLMVQLDYYCESNFKVMLHNIRLTQCIKWFINNNKTLDELNDVINDALVGKTAYLVPRKPIEEDDENPSKNNIAL